MQLGPFGRIVPKIQQVGLIGIVRGGLAEIVEPGPDIFAQQTGIFSKGPELHVGSTAPARTGRVVGRYLPVRMIRSEKIFSSRCDAGRSFTADGRLVFVTGVCLPANLLSKKIIDTHDIERHGSAGLPTPIGVVISVGDGSRGVFFMNDVHQVLRQGNIALIHHFIADGPDKYRWMVPVPANHCLQVFPMPFLEQFIVIIFPFTRFPAIERFIPNEEPQFIGQFQQFWSRRVMRSPQGIAPHFF